ncbi:hypothetical protein ACJQWK_10015 [Exserohilum turcicum]
MTRRGGGVLLQPATADGQPLQALEAGNLDALGWSRPSSVSGGLQQRDAMRLWRHAEMLACWHAEMLECLPMQWGTAGGGGGGGGGGERRRRRRRGGSGGGIAVNGSPAMPLAAPEASKLLPPSSPLASSST